VHARSVFKHRNSPAADLVLLCRYRDLPEPVCRFMMMLPSARYYEGPPVNVDALIQSLLAIPVPFPDHLAPDAGSKGRAFDYGAALPEHLLRAAAAIAAAERQQQLLLQQQQQQQLVPGAIPATAGAASGSTPSGPPVVPPSDTFNAATVAPVPVPGSAPIDAAGAPFGAPSGSITAPPFIPAGAPMDPNPRYSLPPVEHQGYGTGPPPVAPLPSRDRSRERDRLRDHERSSREYGAGQRSYDHGADSYRDRDPRARERDDDRGRGSAYRSAGDDPRRYSSDYPPPGGLDGRVFDDRTSAADKRRERSRSPSGACVYHCLHVGILHDSLQC